MWDYNEKVMDHFLHPRNVGEIKNADGVGEVGNMSCGDALKLSFKLDKDGKIAEAKKMLQVNAVYLKKKAVEYASEQLDKVSADNYDDAEAVQDASQYNKRRKDMQARQSNENNQMAY